MTLKGIADRLQVETKSLGPYLEKLHQLRLIRVGWSLDADRRSRNRRFALNERLIAFWHWFGRPNLSAIMSGAGAEIYDLVVEKRFPE